MVSLSPNARVSDDGEAFAEHIKRVYIEVKTVTKSNNETYANAVNQDCCLNPLKKKKIIVLAFGSRNLSSQ